jgi:hypothetical protein
MAGSRESPIAVIAVIAVIADIGKPQILATAHQSGMALG